MTKLGYLTDVTKTGIAGAGNERKERESEKWEYNRKLEMKSLHDRATVQVVFFLSHSNHSHTDMQLIPLEKIRSSRDSVRKARESHLNLMA